MATEFLIVVQLWRDELHRGLVPRPLVYPTDALRGGHDLRTPRRVLQRPVLLHAILLLRLRGAARPLRPHQSALAGQARHDNDLLLAVRQLLRALLREA